jgi:hypothetical protein
MKKILFLLIITICSLVVTYAQPTRTLPNKTTYRPRAQPPVVIKSAPLNTVQTDKLILVNAKTLYVKVVLRSKYHYGSQTVGNNFKFRVFGDEKQEHNAGRCVLTEVRPNLYKVEKMTPEPSVNRNTNELTWTFQITGIVPGFEMGVDVTNSELYDSGSYYVGRQGMSWFNNCNNLKRLGDTITVYLDYKFRDE